MGAKAADKVIEEFLKAAEDASEKGKDGNMDFFFHTILKENKRLKPLPSFSNISLINGRNKLFFAER